MAHVEGSGIDEAKVALSPDEVIVAFSPVEVIVAISPVEVIVAIIHRRGRLAKIPIVIYCKAIGVSPARRLTVPLKVSDSPGVFVDCFAPGPVYVPL